MAMGSGVAHVERAVKLERDVRLLPLPTAGHRLLTDRDHLWLKRGTVVFVVNVKIRSDSVAEDQEIMTLLADGVLYAILPLESEGAAGERERNYLQVEQWLGARR